MGWASPLNFKKRSKCPCHWKAVWLGQPRAGFRHPWVGNLGMPLCVLVCFAFVVICFPGTFLVKAPSLTGLIQGKRRFLSACMRKPECSRGRTRGYWAGARGNSWAASVVPVFQAISVAPRSCCFPPPHQRQLGQLRTSPKHSLILPRFVPTHQGKLLALGADTLLSSQVSSQGSSRVKTEELAPAKLDGAGQGARVA